MEIRVRLSFNSLIFEIFHFLSKNFDISLLLSKVQNFSRKCKFGLKSYHR